ncbi:DUF5818 domain-containing protein [Novosphingopyxis sp.]|uniref:DUF5818 domain-containing protein n=1 Tax=Novosphingopyxis sp. TaxID=2709690 RepID=UPI003B5A2EC9
MPRGAAHLETGKLGHDGHGFLLLMDGGGRWRLDITRSQRKLVGEQVIVRGTRADFDLLDVHKIWQAGEPEPRTMYEALICLLGNFKT